MTKTERKTLFVNGHFVAHSGATLRWKIECDSLTAADWQTLALATFEVLAANNTLTTLMPHEIVGIPTGGLKFAAALREAYWTGPGPRLIVDDVLTTGASMRQAMDRPDDIGLVVFARGPLPPRVLALFSMPTVLK